MSETLEFFNKEQMMCYLIEFTQLQVWLSEDNEKFVIGDTFPDDGLNYYEAGTVADYLPYTDEYAEEYNKVVSDE